MPLDWAVFLIVIYCSSVIKSSTASHSLHTSSFEMRQVWSEEVQAVKRLENILNLTTQIQASIREYLRDFRSLNLHLQNGSDFLENPVNAFLFLRHVGLGWKEIHSTLNKTQEVLQSEMRNVLSRAETGRVPDETEVDGASTALGRLHFAYKLNLTALVAEDVLTTTLNGQILRHPIIASLSEAWDLCKIGLDSANHQLLDSAVDFLSAATEKSKRDGDSWKYFGHSIDRKRINNFLKTATKIHDQVLERNGFFTDKHSTRRLPFSEKLAKKEKYQNLARIEPILYEDITSQKRAGQLQSTNRSFEEYQALRLCRGEQLRAPRQEASLYCRYMHNDSPWLRIGPLKGDIQSLEPFIIVFRNMLLESQCDNIIRIAGNQLAIPPVTNKVLRKWSLKNVWLTEKDSNSLDLLTKRIEAIADVQAKSGLDSENFMIGNYGIGGNYQVHADYHVPSDSGMTKPPTGDRIATLMTYLEAPLSGGSTVWPWLGVAIRPEKGSSVLWWNTYPSERLDGFTRHMACPVLIGEKWIANKWIGYDAQWTLGCLSDPNRRFQIPLQ